MDILVVCAVLLASFMDHLELIPETKGKSLEMIENYWKTAYAGNKSINPNKIYEKL
jgi:hypothetical protein